MTERRRRIFPPAIQKPPPKPVRFPWLVPAIVVLAVLVVAAGITIAAVTGILFTAPVRSHG